VRKEERRADVRRPRGASVESAELALLKQNCCWSPLLGAPGVSQFAGSSLGSTSLRRRAATGVEAPSARAGCPRRGSMWGCRRGLRPHRAH